jgi:hypothetical protein
MHFVFPAKEWRFSALARVHLLEWPGVVCYADPIAMLDEVHRDLTQPVYPPKNRGRPLTKVTDQEDVKKLIDD